MRVASARIGQHEQPGAVVPPRFSEEAEDRAFDRDENVAGGGDECAAGALAEEIDTRRGIEPGQDRHIGLSAASRSPRVRLGITKRARELAVEAHVRRFGVQSYAAELCVAAA